MLPTVSPATAARAIAALARAGVRRSVILVGAPGIGKSAAAERAAADLGAPLYVSNPAVEESVEYRGLPYVVGHGDDARARWLPLGAIDDLQRLSSQHNDGLIIWEIADLPQAPPSTQAALMQLLHKGSVAGHDLPRGVFPVVTANRAHDAAGAEHGILWTIRDRAASVLGVETRAEDWLPWAARSGVHPLVLAFIGARPDDLCSTERPSLSVEEIAPTPRGWERASDILRADLPPELADPLLAGRLGEGTAGRFAALRSAYHRLPDLDTVAQDPDGAPMLSGAQDAYLAVAMVAHAAARTDDATAARGLVRYLARYDEEHRALARTIIMGRRPDGDVPGLSALAVD